MWLNCVARLFSCEFRRADCSFHGCANALATITRLLDQVYGAFSLGLYMRASTVGVSIAGVRNLS